MNVSSGINFTPLEMGLLVIVAALLAKIVFSRRVCSVAQSGQPIDREDLKQWIKESELICESLSKNLQEKRKIVKRLISQLDAKISEINSLLQQVEERSHTPKEEEKNRNLYPLIVEMASAGCEVPQISKWLKIPEGEVQLILDLRRFGSAEGSRVIKGEQSSSPLT